MKILYRILLKRYGAFFMDIFKEYYFSKYNYYASALTFSSLLSIVPTITIFIAILTALPFYNNIAHEVENFIFTHFITATSTNIQGYLQDTVNNALHMSAISLLFLVAVSLQMINTLEHTINTIWEIKATRSLVSAGLLYCAILCCGPLLIGTGLIFNSIVAASSWLDNAFIPSTLICYLLRYTPIILSTLAFALIYIIMPNRQVPARNGFIAGFIAAILFEAAKSLFGLYIKHFSDYEVVYGSLAAIPIFLLWIYISWCIVLLGAVMCKALTIRKHGN